VSPQGRTSRYDARHVPGSPSEPEVDEVGSGEVAGFPQVFGKYVLLRPMARGGMGELFLAAAGETGGFEKLCVVKKVLHSLEDQAVHRRFLDEAKVVVRLNHQNLVQVFDAGRVDNEYYLAMELVEGKDLRAVWNRCAQLHRRIPVDIAIFVVREVLRGLDYVHDAMGLDLVHRDISPPNLLVGYRGDVKLTDFGLAKSAIKREMTSPGVVFGRYSYLSPEQARGLPADRRTDIYACGIVLWELLTGRQLFPSNNKSHGDALAAVRNPEVRAPSSLVPGIPDGLDAVLLQALHKEQKQRFATAGAFRAALSEVLAREFPTCDADRVSEFMRDIFARESKLEARDYAGITARDFSELRAGVDSQSISIADVIETAEGQRPSTIPLHESDIVELDQSRFERPELKDLRESASEWVGQVVAQRYRLDGLIGIGGMGAVFRATHLALGKPFALKVLHRVYTRDSDIITRFMREARAATQTGHPNIIDVLDIGTTEEGDVYFAMELLDGEDLGKVIAVEAPLAVRRAVHITRQICRALAAAHEAGIIHRDLKSENVILITRGNDSDFVKVLDFGICKHMNADSATTSPGLVMGSPDYMAPEQGAGLEATAAADVYAVGCILFEMLTGRLPFQGRNAVDVLMQKGAYPAPRATTLRQEIPEALADVIARCLERQPGDRPPSMRSLEYELTRAIDGRASAVAAVLGLGEDSRRDTHSPDEGERVASASMSMHRAVVAAAMGERRPGQRGGTQIAPNPLSPANLSGPYPSTEAASRPSAMMAGAKALFFVALGGALAGAVVLALSPQTLQGLIGSESSPEPSAARGGAQEVELPDRAGASTAEAVEDAHEVDADDPEGAEGSQKAELVEGEPAAERGPRTPAELVEVAERALQAAEWREPAEQSLAVALTNLSIADPGNEAIGRLRREAAEQLVPVGRKALERNDHEAATVAFRDLASVWPDHDEARAGLVEALRGLAKAQRRAGEHEAALATADELLNLRPGDFGALLLRADMLFALERWGDAKATYTAARKANPRSSAAKKGFFKAARELRKSERKRNAEEQG
jgi:eukaryotic-like serine/threonine-protein kinase